MNKPLKQEGGLYTKGFRPRAGSEDKPLISVITVVCNGVEYIEETILSVINQTYENLEYIIIDNRSDDGTLDIIKKYEHRISYWMSEEDNGIYDAMNKGIALAHGEWLNFMNCGDTFYNNAVLSSTDFRVPYDLIIGNTQVIDENGNLLEFRSPIVNRYLLLLGNFINHQSTFIRKNRQEKYKPFTILGDYYLWLKLIYKEHIKFIKINRIIANYRDNGVSVSDPDLWHTEELLIKKELTKLGYFLTQIRIFIKIILPSVTHLVESYILRRNNKMKK